MELVRVLTLKDSVEIEAPKEAIEDWLLAIDEHYSEWHPAHVKWVNLDGELAEGRTFYYEEYLKGRLYKSRCRITKLERDGKTYIEFVGLSLPDRLIGISGSFAVEPHDDACTVTAVLNFRFGWPLKALGFAGAIEEHMAEEGESLKRLLE